MSASKVNKMVAAAVATGAIVVGGAMLANAATRTPSTATSSTSSPSSDAGRAGDGLGGPGGSGDTPVTGDELSKVTAAVKAKDSTVTVDRVQKDPDGSYDVFGTKSGAKVMYEVSSDLKTITQNTAAGKDGRGGPGGPGSPTGPTGSATPNGSTALNSSTASNSSTTSDSSVTTQG